MDNLSSGMWVMMAVFMAVMVVVMLGIGWALVRSAVSRRRRGGGDKALDELRLRHARGEIDAEDFEAQRRELTRS